MSVFRFWKSDVKRDIDDELRFHFDARIEELVSRGATPDEARVRAVAEFGDVDAVRSDLRVIDDRIARRRQRFEFLDGLWQDLRYAARALRRTPAVSLTIVLALALGLGVNAAMFSLLDVIFLRPPDGVADAGQVRRLWSHVNFRSGGQFWSGYDYASFAALERDLGDRARLAIYEGPRKAIYGRGEEAPRINLAMASAAYFPLLGVRPEQGRFYAVDEDRLEAGAPVVVLSERFWQREFGGERDAIGRDIELGGRPYTIIGVAAAGFSGVDLDAVDAWVPLASNPSYGPATQANWFTNSNINGFQVLLRLPEGASVAELEQRATITLRRPDVGPIQDTTTVARLGSIVKARGPGNLSEAVQVAERAGGVAIIVLLIAFANVVNLLLARAVKRRREIAVRLALGISSSRLVRLLVTESVLLAVFAALAALVAARWGGVLLRALLMPEVTWAADPLHWRVLLVGMLVAVAAGIGAGMVPALQSRAPDLTKALKSGMRDGGGQRSRLRGFLVASQAALSVVLIAGAALFIRSLQNARDTDIGYAVDRLGFASVSAGSDRVARAEISNRLLQLEDRIASVPGIERVAYTSMRPNWGIQFTSWFAQSAKVNGKVPGPGFYSAVSPGFFDATGTRILRGRTFASGAAGQGERAVLVNQAAVDSIWPNEDPLGRCLRFEKPDAPCYTVIGVTQNSLVVEFQEQSELKAYLPLGNLPFEGWGVGDVVLRIQPARLTTALAQVRDMLRAEFPGRTVTTNTMAAAMEPEYRPWRLGAILFTLFGGLAAVVAAIGVFSSVSYAVSQRTHEFGVRMALGASNGRIVGDVVVDGLRTVIIGIAAGILLALVFGRIVASLLYGISPGNPLAMLVAAGVLLSVAAAASFAPAWRAGRSDPVSALRVD